MGSLRERRFKNSFMMVRRTISLTFNGSFAHSSGNKL
jgi:hypothetical protein